jgi:hypothetical protein
MSRVVDPDARLSKLLLEESEFVNTQASQVAEPHPVDSLPHATQRFGWFNRLTAITGGCQAGCAFCSRACRRASQGKRETLDPLSEAGIPAAGDRSTFRQIPAGSFAARNLSRGRRRCKQHAISRFGCSPLVRGADLPFPEKLHVTPQTVYSIFQEHYTQLAAAGAPPAAAEIAPKRWNSPDRSFPGRDAASHLTTHTTSTTMH